MNWFISHPTGAEHNTPQFFRALKSFEKKHPDIKVQLPPDHPMTFDERRQQLGQSDLVVAEVSIASTGTGIDLGLAHAAGKDVVAFHTSTSAISPIVPVVATAIHAYLSEEKIVEVLETLV